MSVSSKDALFEPSLQGRVYTAEPPAKRPWRLGAQVFVAFFGGSLALTAIAFLNARRLDLPAGRRWLILAVGLVWGLLGLAALAYLFENPGLVTRILGESLEPRTGLRIGSRVLAVLLFGLFYALQKSADRGYAIRYAKAEEPYASLWIPGLLAVFGFAAIQIALVTAIVMALRP